MAHALDKKLGIHWKILKMFSIASEKFCKVFIISLMLVEIL